MVWIPSHPCKNSAFLKIPAEKVGHLHQLTNHVSTLWDVCTLCLECLFMVLSSSLSLRLKCCGKSNGDPVGLAAGCSAESTVFYSQRKSGRGWKWLVLPTWISIYFNWLKVNLNQKFQKSIEMNHFRIFINLNWAIKNAPIPSHYTSWFIAFPAMGYHNPQ